MRDPIGVVGIGNTLMGDDGFGVRVAEELKRLMPQVPVTTGHLAGMGLMRPVMAADAVIFVDAMDCGDEPGTLYRMDPDDAGISKLRSMTSHGMGIPYLITNARLLGHFPRFVVYAVQIEDITCGEDFTPHVASALPHTVELIAEEIGRILAGEEAAGQ